MAKLESAATSDEDATNKVPYVDALSTPGGVGARPRPAPPPSLPSKRIPRGTGANLRQPASAVCAAPSRLAPENAAVEPSRRPERELSFRLHSRPPMRLKTIGAICAGVVAVCAIAYFALRTDRRSTASGWTSANGSASGNIEKTASTSPGAEAATGAAVAPAPRGAAVKEARADAEPAKPAAPTILPISITSKPPGATVMLVDNGRTSLVGTTPVTALVDPTHSSDLVFTLADHQTRIEHVAPAARHVMVDLPRQ
jgi:hypothetical protein